ncbi:MAG: CoA-binding protein, partial [Balneolaceae bacterium]|nr:CoA-binding protein [Balneolaceae bacterium]
MIAISDAAKKFLSFQNIVVVGVSSHGDVAANIIYKKLRDSGYNIFAVNPNAEMVEGDKCYPNLESIPEEIEGVVIGTAPDVTPQILNECAALGIEYVWIHRSFGKGS